MPIETAVTTVNDNTKNINHAFKFGHLRTALESRTSSYFGCFRVLITMLAADFTLPALTLTSVNN